MQAVKADEIQQQRQHQIKSAEGQEKPPPPFKTNWQKASSARRQVSNVFAVSDTPRIAQATAHAFTGTDKAVSRIYRTPAF